MAAMEILSVLRIPAYLFLLLPLLPVAMQIADRLIRGFMGSLWHRYEDQLAWGSGADPDASSPAGRSSEEPEWGRETLAAECVNWLFGRKQNTRRYRSDTPTQCVICLCDVDDGDEIRELKCDHVFHRGCLDRWVGFGRVTCPLCREPLSTKAPAVELPCQAALPFELEPTAAC